MRMVPPESKELTSVSEHYGLGLSASDIAAYVPAAQGLLASWGVVERLYAAETEGAAPERPWTRPEPADNPLNAWWVRTNITATDEGPLAGRTIAVKDNTALAGVPMMNGSATVEGFVPRRDATIVTRLLTAGATIAGKSVCEDMCFSGGSHTAKTGPVRNPWDPTRTSGGSSSGSGALLAGGAVDLATGGDQGGSVRIPAAFCGIVGHKPTHGLVPYTGAFPIEQSIDHLGPMARTVSDVALMLTIMAGSDGYDPRQRGADASIDYLAALEQDASGLRIGVVSEGFERPNSEAEVDAAAREAVDALCGAGLNADEVSIPWHLYGAQIWDVIATEGATWQMVDGNGYGMNWQGLYDPDLIDFYGGKWRDDAAAFSETVKLVLLAGRHTLDRYHGRHYAMARNLTPTLRAAYDTALESYDVLVMPTLPIRASLIPAADAPLEESLARALEMVGNTAPLDVTGHPACSVPAGLSSGLPVGLMIIGKHHDDATVLRVAHTLETVRGGFPTPQAVTIGNYA